MVDIKNVGLSKACGPVRDSGLSLRDELDPLNPSSQDVFLSSFGPSGPSSILSIGSTSPSKARISLSPSPNKNQTPRKKKGTTQRRWKLQARALASLLCGLKVQSPLKCSVNSIQLSEDGDVFKRRRTRISPNDLNSLTKSLAVAVVQPHRTP